MGRPGREFGHIGQTSQTLYLDQLDYEEAFLFPKPGQIGLSKKDYVAQNLSPNLAYTISNLICQTFVFGVIIMI